MVESHKNESCNVIDLRDIVFFAVSYLRNEKKDRVEKEVYEEWEVVDKGVFEKEKERKKRETLHLRITKKKILNEPNHELLYYVKPPYPILKEKPNKENKNDQLKTSMENFIKHQVKVSFCEAVPWEDNFERRL